MYVRLSVLTLSPARSSYLFFAAPHHLVSSWMVASTKIALGWNSSMSVPCRAHASALSVCFPFDRVVYTASAILAQRSANSSFVGLVIAPHTPPHTFLTSASLRPRDDTAPSSSFNSSSSSNGFRKNAESVSAPGGVGGGLDTAAPPPLPPLLSSPAASAAVATPPLLVLSSSMRAVNLCLDVGWKGGRRCGDGIRWRFTLALFLKPVW